jgi:hypothetical protein
MNKKVKKYAKLLEDFAKTSALINQAYQNLDGEEKRFVDDCYSESLDLQITMEDINYHCDTLEKKLNGK